MDKLSPQIHLLASNPSAHIRSCRERVLCRPSGIWTGMEWWRRGERTTAEELHCPGKACLLLTATAVLSGCRALLGDLRDYHVKDTWLTHISNSRSGRGTLARYEKGEREKEREKREREREREREGEGA
jgi:hypothetical protein